MPSLNTKLASAPNTTTNYVLKATSSSTIGNSLFSDNGTNGAFGGANYSAGTGVRTFNITASQYAGIAFWTDSGNSGDIFSYFSNGNMVIMADPSNIMSASNLILGADGTTIATLNTTNVTLARPLSGTSATFSGNVTLTGSATTIQLQGTSYGNIAADKALYIDAGGSSAMFLRTNGGVNALILASTGAATFASSVTFANGVTNNIGSDKFFLGSGGYNYIYSRSTGLQILNQADTTALVTILNDGNVGIGTISPTAKLEISGTNSQVTSAIYQTIASTDSSAGLLMQASSTSHYPFIRFNQGSSGKLELGVTGSGDSFGGGNFYLNFNTATGSTGAALRIASTGAATFSSSVRATRFEITPSGTFRLNTNADDILGYMIRSGTWKGTTENDLALATDGPYGISFYTNGSASERMKILSNGIALIPSVYSQTSGSAANVIVGSDGNLFRSTSSLKYKKNVQNYTKGLAEVMQLRPVTYNGINELDGDKEYAGLIAEEIHELGLTEFVQYAEDGSPDALSYQNMVSLLVKAIQELNQTVQNQQQQINSLINR